jgi:hypothetical protein
MSTEREQVRLLGAVLGNDVTSSGNLCPFCNGGRHTEKSLSVTKRKDGTLLYICHRASCGEAGRIEASGSFSPPRGSGVRRFIPRFFTGKSRLLTDSERSLLREDYGLTLKTQYWFRLSVDCEHESRLLCPLFTRDGDVIGYQSRLFPNRYYTSMNDHGGVPAGPIPKTMTYKFKDVPCIGWYNWPEQQHDKVLLVEDCISAMRGSHHLPSVALCGSHLTLDMLMDILMVTDNIILALDKDATEKAYAFQKKFSFIAPHMQVMPLEVDLKYETYEKICERLRPFE